jgi:hypothetical protein
VLEPLATIVPRVEFPPAIPFTSHTLLAPAGRQKDAVKVCCWPRPTFVESGEIEFVAAQVIVAVALPNFELSAALVAVTVTAGGEGGADGAVYAAVVVPVDTIVPMVELPPAIPFTLHVKPAAGLPIAVSLAVKTCSPFVGTLTALGATVTATSSSRLTIAEPLACVSAWLTAVTVALGGAGRMAGAV